jgi:hypothetical protein
MESENTIGTWSHQEVKQVIDIMLLSFGKLFNAKNERWLQSLWQQIFALLENDEKTVVTKNIFDVANLLTDPQITDETLTELDIFSEGSIPLRDRLKFTAYWIFRELRFSDRNLSKSKWTTNTEKQLSRHFDRTPNYMEELKNLKDFLLWDHAIFRKSESLKHEINKKFARFNFKTNSPRISQVLNFNLRNTMSPKLAKAIYLLIEEDIDDGDQKAQIFCNHLVKTYGEDALEKMDRVKWLEEKKSNPEVD